nr:ubiquitin-conjugating enzyme E2 Z-like [Rhipicephalus microplus]
MDEPRRSAATCNLETALTQPKQPSGQCLLRLNDDLKNVIDNPVPGVFFEPEKGNVTYVHAVTVGPDNTPCQGGSFHFVLKFPLDNPACRPQVRFMATDGGRVRFHRKLYSSGLVSLSIPGTFHGPSWNPAMTLKTVVVSIQLLFIEQPLANEPALGREMETWLEKTTGYNAKLCSQTLRVAICDELEACLLGNSLYPQDLHMAVIKHFVEQYDKYESVAFSLLGGDSSVEESQQYAVLLERLQDLHG